LLALLRIAPDLGITSFVIGEFVGLSMAGGEELFEITAKNNF
jgi:hypothetical protein